jgi:hypothetical protein
MKIEKNMEKNYNYYLKNKQELKEKYNNKFIIIKNETIFGVYENLQKAIQSAKNLEAGTYIIQHCTDNENVQTFHTRVRFNA